jgi:phospholipid N-methyltransferase
MVGSMRETLTFVGQWFRRFRTTGAIAPSGGPLARAMATAVGHLPPGAVIVELGPGTGVFTRELLRRYPGNPLLAIEFNPVFANLLRQRLPTAAIAEGCASEIRNHLCRVGLGDRPVAAVVSGLPMLVMPRDLTDRIIGAVTEVLAPGGRFVQFTYSKRAWRRFMPDGFRPERSRKVWWNVPPAVVLPFVRTPPAA